MDPVESSTGAARTITPARSEMMPPASYSQPAASQAAATVTETPEYSGAQIHPRALAACAYHPRRALSPTGLGTDEPGLAKLTLPKWKKII